MHARKTSIAELENARDLHGETNHTYWVTSPRPPAFCYLRFLVPTYLASCGPHVMLDIFCIIDSQRLSKDFFFV
jgi:hypothetical protein